LRGTTLVPPPPSGARRLLGCIGPPGFD